MNTQEKVTEERFLTMESVFTLRMQKLKTQSVDGAADMARETEDRQDRANNINDHHVQRAREFGRF